MILLHLTQQFGFSMYVQFALLFLMPNPMCNAPISNLYLSTRVQDSRMLTSGTKTSLKCKEQSASQKKYSLLYVSSVNTVTLPLCHFLMSVYC
jgi:hypothetical protein